MPVDPAVNREPPGSHATARRSRADDHDCDRMAVNEQLMSALGPEALPTLRKELMLACF